MNYMLVENFEISLYLLHRLFDFVEGYKNLFHDNIEIGVSLIHFVTHPSCLLKSLSNLLILRGVILYTKREKENNRFDYDFDCLTRSPSSTYTDKIKILLTSGPRPSTIKTKGKHPVRHDPQKAK